MPSFHWTTESVLFMTVMSAVLFAVGFLLAMLLQARKVAQLSAQWENDHRAYEQIRTASADLEAQLKQVECRAQQSALTEGKQSEQRAGGKSGFTRANH
ncbi:MAG: hypothetical protein P8176_11595 [Gammaproteobacteria bacterium]